METLKIVLMIATSNIFMTAAVVLLCIPIYTYNAYFYIGVYIMHSTNAYTYATSHL